MDTLSDVLRAVRLTGAVFFAIDASAPWGTEMPPARTIAPHIMPGIEHVIEYQLVTARSCWGGLLDQPAVRLQAGDVIVFPQGDPHVISSAPGTRGRPEFDAYRFASERQLLFRCPWFPGCDARPFNPLLATLPRVIHSRGTGESDSALRRLVENVGWFAGLRDESVGGRCRNFTSARRMPGASRSWPRRWGCRAPCSRSARLLAQALAISESSTTRRLEGELLARSQGGGAVEADLAAGARGAGNRRALHLDAGRPPRQRDRPVRGGPRRDPPDDVGVRVQLLARLVGLSRDRARAAERLARCRQAVELARAGANRHIFAYALDALAVAEFAAGGGLAAIRPASAGENGRGRRAR